MQLTDTSRNQESLKKIIDLNSKIAEYSQEVLQSQQTIKELEAELENRKGENERLKKQIQEMDYSFAKQGNSGVMKPENFNLEASSIDQKDDESQDGDEHKVKRLETEIEEYQKLNQDLERLNHTLKVEIKELKKQNLSGSHQATEQDIADQLKHTRSILIRFLEKTPIT